MTPYNHGKEVLREALRHPSQNEDIAATRLSFLFSGLAKKANHILEDPAGS